MPGRCVILGEQRSLQVSEQGSDMIQAELEEEEHDSLWWAQLDRDLKSAAQV